MESWSYASEGKGLLFSDEVVDLSVDSFARSRKTLMGWESVVTPPCNFDINKLMSDRDAVENMEFMDLGFTDLTRKSFHSNTTVEILNGEVGSNSSKRVLTPPCFVTSNSFFVEEEEGSKISSSLLESNSQDSTLIDLKLGRLADSREAQSDKFLKERSVVSSARPSLTSKRARATSSSSQTPFCQVYGCNKDLSSSKDYHKRHKVCEVHTKTPKVIVNGKEQRFCQQCSRFHLLAEFDDNKRSCRRRLAGHNERRRKPQFNIFSGRPQKFPQSYQGNNFLKGASYVFPDVLPGGILFPERNEEAKFEEKPFCSSQSEIPITSGQLLTKSFLHLQGNGKQYSPGIPPSATEGYNFHNAASTGQESSGISHSSCALSLLSAQSHNLSSRSSAILAAKPLINQASRVHHSRDQHFDKTAALTYMEKYTTNGLYSSGMSSMDVAQTGSFMVPDAGQAGDMVVEADGYIQEPELTNTKCFHSHEHGGSTVDLIQLSSHLKRVEQQRTSMQLKQENDDFCYFLTS